MSQELASKIKFIEQELPRLMVVKGETVLDCRAEAKIQLDGFMSSVFTVEALTQRPDGE